jgi:hypothetical protein
LHDPVGDQGHVVSVPKDSNDSVDPFSHIVREKELVVKAPESLVSNETGVLWSGVGGGAEGSGRDHWGKAEAWGDEGRRGEGFWRGGNGESGWGHGDPSW